MDIGARIKKRREELGMSQEELAKMVGYKSRSSVNKIEIDGRGLPQNKIVMFAKALETTPADLMGWEQIDSRFFGKEASDEVYDKLAQNIKRHHGQTKELLDVYKQLSSENKNKTLQYSKGLLYTQKMEEAMPDAAQQRTDIEIPKDVDTSDDDAFDDF